MLLLLFSAGSTRFAIRAREVIEVLPFMELKPLIGVPSFVSGLCNFRGQFVPILDLNMLLNNKPCLPYMTSRILLVYYPLSDESGTDKKQLLGILVESLTESVKKDPDSFSSSGIYPVDKPFIGSNIYKDGDDIVHLICIDELLSDDVRELVLKSAEREWVDE